MSYALSKEATDAARKSENRTSFIDEKGKYVGIFTKAEDIKARSGARGIALSFKGNDGVLSNFSIYTEKADGTKLSDFGLVIAIMTCLSIRDMKPVKSILEEYDRDAKATVKREAMQFTELLNKQIGTLFVMEEYERQDGGFGWSARLNAVFRAADELVASEILDRKTHPEKLASLVESLRDRPLKKKAGGNARSSGARGSDEGMHGGAFDDGAPFDENIPF